MKITNDKKIEAIIRIEPGCLGPEGFAHVAQFCSQSQALLMKNFAHPYLTWTVEGRIDKALPELEYRIMNRPLTRDQAQRYLSLFGQEIDQFETKLFQRIADLVDHYFDR